MSQLSIPSFSLMLSAPPGVKKSNYSPWHVGCYATIWNAAGGDMAVNTEALYPYRRASFGNQNILVTRGIHTENG
jgi:hypothetical protein